MLDDAASHEQVTPLLPGTGGSGVLITSRRHLTALEDAAAISLDTLAPGEAAALLARLAGRPGLGSGDGPAGEITRLCGYLPLAIGMLARQLHHHPAWTAADLAAELAAAAGRLELMRAENLSVAAAFDLSYQDLTEGQQRLFRRLGVHPGSDIDAYAAAALDGTDLATARRLLDGLYDHYLLTEPARGRYRLHDLLREHARALAFAGDPADADAAAGRLLDYYLHTAAAAGQHIETRNTVVIRPPPGEPPAVAPLLVTASRASAWLDAERANLDAAAGYAAGRGRLGHAIAILAAISGYLFARGHWDQSASLHRAALASAGQAGDRAGQAGALNELGILQRATGAHPAAAASHRQALELYRGLGDRLGQANALSNLGEVQAQTGDYPAAAASHEQALGMFRVLGDRRGQAITTGNLGALQLRTGDYPAAAVSLTQALGIYGELGDRGSQAGVLNDLGEMLSRSGGGQQARDHHARALTIAREISAPLEEARALEGIGHCLHRDGDPGGAAAHWQRALAIYDRIGAPDVQRIQDTLRQHGITTTPPPPSGKGRQPDAPTASS